MATPLSDAGFRVTYFWAAVGRKRYGWSESFFHPGPDQSRAQAAAIALQPQLIQYHGVDITLDFVRISDLTNFRAQKLLQIGQTVTGPPGADFQVNVIVDAVLFSLLAANGRRVKQSLRGVPDGNIGKGGQLLGGFAFYNSLLSKLNSEGFVLRGLPRPQTFSRVTAWAQDTGILTIPGHGWTTPLRIRVKGVRTLYPRTFNRIFLVSVIDANTVQIASWTAVNPVTPIDLSNAQAAAQYYTNSTIQGPPTSSTDGSYPLGSTSHKTGRPFNLSTGRRRGRRTPAPGILVVS
jgi:hypothetical protein